MITCYDRARLRQFLKNRLPEQAQQEITKHIDGCARCQEKLDRLTGNRPASRRGGGSEMKTPLPNGTLVLDGVPSGAEPEPDEWPVIPGYAIRQRLGRGGMAVVYEAIETRAPRRQVALKLMQGGRDGSRRDRERFLTDAEALGRLEHPNIIPVHEVGSYRGGPFFTMQYAAGGDLENRIGDAPQVPACAARLVETLARAVHHAHQRGVIHRDLKPSNILLSVPDPGTDSASPTGLGSYVPKVADFGLAKLLDSGAGLTGSRPGIYGTVPYMAPEQAAGQSNEIGTHTDVHALGAILYRLLTGRLPYEGETDLAVIKRICSESDTPRPPSRLRPGLPTDLELICMKCLEKKPAERYATAEQLADELRRFRAHEPLQHTRAVGYLERLRLWVHRNRPLAAALSFGAVATVTLFVLAIWFGIYQARSAERANHSAREYRLLFAEALRDQALGRFEKGDLRRGMLELVRALETAPEDAVDLRRTIRANLAAWADGVPGLAGPPLEHPDEVEAVAFTPDGRLALTGCADGGVRVWDAVAGRETARLDDHRGKVHAVAIGADGRYAVTAGEDGARLWDLATLTLRHGLGTAETYSAAFSPDGRNVLLGGGAEATVWDVNAGQPLRRLPHSCKVHAVAWSPTAPRLVLTGGTDEQAHLWDPATGEVIDSLAFARPIRTVAFSPDGQTFVAAGLSRSIQLWDTRSRNRLHSLPVDERVLCAAFSPDGRVLVTAGADKMVRFWDRETGEPIAQSLPHRGPVGAVAYRPGGKVVLTGCGREGRLWEAAPDRFPTRTLRHPGEVLAAAFSPDGNLFSGEQILLKGASTLRWWNRVPSAEEGQSLPLPWPVRVVAVNPSGNTALAGSGSFDGTVIVFETVSGRPIRSFPPQPGRERGIVTAAEFSPDGQLVLVTTSKGLVYLGEVATGREIRLEHQGTIVAGAFSPDGLHVATGGQNGARLWTSNGQPTHWLHRGKTVQGVAFSPDGRSLALGCEDGSSCVYDVAAGTVTRELRGHQDQVKRVAFSPCGGFVLTGSNDATARVWDISAENPVGRVLSHRGPVNAIAFSPDGRMILTGATLPDRAAYLWDTRTGTPIGPPLSHSNLVNCVAFGPGGTMALTGSSDKTLRLWRVRSLEEDGPRTRLWIETLTGLEPDGNGGVRELSGPAWQERRLRLEALGGPPVR
ncbi:Serine/threonine-protein kinase PrkC [Gemmata sp. SH-PL17]|uniref:WD40 repeat domain-containing serine/threonine protein kinase n=1 Tax=Gemmata sp. SH-PL17 TaxID=1630693 RepID=UPI00078D9B7F|nr:serine/threonine-protein kinase [Gemmata sp. SH-PL17]AMV24436.1 Serine/threonine-protein kinase PrkC [Gemmata sp. SH-PL17]